MLQRLSIYLFLLMFLAIENTANAQYIHLIQGNIRDKTTGNLLSGASVNLRNTKLTTISNEDGYFSLRAEQLNTDDSIAVSNVGYKTSIISLASFLNGKMQNISLEPVSYTLDEVVVKSLTLRQILDSIRQHNDRLFIQPIKLSGYYREVAYTDSITNSYSDAICDYYYSKEKTALKINASRCVETKVTYKDKKDFKGGISSGIDPNRAFEYAYLDKFLERFYPDKSLSNYKYKRERPKDDSNEKTIKLIISPQPNSNYDLYQTTFYLNSEDYTLAGFSLEIPKEMSPSTRVNSFLGIHGQNVAYNISVKYTLTNNGLCLDNYSISRIHHLWGSFLARKSISRRNGVANS